MRIDTLRLGSEAVTVGRMFGSLPAWSAMLKLQGKEKRTLLKKWFQKTLAADKKKIRKDFKKVREIRSLKSKM